MKTKGTFGFSVCMIFAALALACPSSQSRAQDVSDFERYVQTYKCRVPVWRDEKWKRELRCLRIPYDSKGRVPLLKGFEDHCDVIEIGDWKHPVTLEKGVHIFTIDWPADSTDGTLTLTILPNFIFLRTSHNNPNPDEFLWYRYLAGAQYAAFERFFKEALQSGALRHFDKSSVDSVDWTPAYVENYSSAYQVNGSPWLIDEAIWCHFISANMNFLFDRVNRYLLDKSSWLRFPDWKDYEEEQRGILYATYLEDELDGGAGARMIPRTQGVAFYSRTVWNPKIRPVAFSVSNRGEHDVQFTVDVEFLDGEKVVGRSSDILAASRVSKEPMRLASHTAQTFTWVPKGLDKKWARGGQWSARLQLKYGESPGTHLEKGETFGPFTLGFPETLDEVFQLPEHREALLELYFRLKERQLRDGFQSLTPAEALLVDLWDLEGSPSHSVWNYFAHRANRAPQAVAALQTLGASCVAKHMKNVIAFFPGGRIPAKTEERERIMRTWAMEADKSETLDALSDTFWAKYDQNPHPPCKEDLNELLYGYLDQHRGEIHW